MVCHPYLTRLQYPNEKTMPKKKNESSKQRNVRVGNISDISGNVNVAGGNINADHMTVRMEESKTIFLDIYRDIERTRPGPLPVRKI